MARFTFELDPVLEQRRREERDRQLALSELERERVALEDEIRVCQRAMDEEREELRDMLGTGRRVDLRGARLQAGATLSHMARAQRAVLKLAGLHKRIESSRAELVEASKRRKSVEMLRERREAEWKRGLSLREDRELDDLGVMRHEREEFQ